jgi:hypothetical protein
MVAGYLMLVKIIISGYSSIASQEDKKLSKTKTDL